MLFVPSEHRTHSLRLLFCVYKTQMNNDKSDVRGGRRMPNANTPTPLCLMITRYLEGTSVVDHHRSAAFYSVANAHAIL